MYIIVLPSWVYPASHPTVNSAPRWLTCSQPVPQNHSSLSGWVMGTHCTCDRCVTMALRLSSASSRFQAVQCVWLLFSYFLSISAPNFFLPVFHSFLLCPFLWLLESMQSSHGCPERKVELVLFGVNCAVLPRVVTMCLSTSANMSAYAVATRFLPVNSCWIRPPTNRSSNQCATVHRKLDFNENRNEG